MRLPRTKVPISRKTIVCVLAMAYAFLVASISWDLVRADGAGWNDRIVLLQQFERQDYEYLYERGWTDAMQNYALWYRAVDDCAPMLGGFKSVLTLLSFIVSAVYAASVLGASYWLLPLLFLPMQIDLFDTQIRSACAGALLIAAIHSNRLTISILLALISMCLHAVAALLVGLWIFATSIERLFRGSRVGGIWILVSASLITGGGIACWMFIFPTWEQHSTETNSVSVTAFCGAMFVLGAAAICGKHMDRHSLFSLLVFLIVGAGGTLGLGTQRLLPITMPVAAAAFLRFRDPYKTIAGTTWLVAQTYWTARWLGA